MVLPLGQRDKLATYEKGIIMKSIQEIRGEVRELLSGALVNAAAHPTDSEWQNYYVGVAAALRDVLAVIEKSE